MRYHIIDTLRGITLISMIGFHLVWDLAYMFNCTMPSFYFNGGEHLWNQAILWAFILISGFCLGLGHHPYRRGAIVFGCGALVTLVTVLFMPDEAIWFGVLSFLGAAMLVTAALRRWLDKVPAWAGLAICLVLFVLLRDIPNGYLGFEGWHIAELPSAFYANWVTTAFGFQFDGFASTDYVPFLPWIFLYFAGYFVWRLCSKPDGSLRLPQTPDMPVLNWIGRNTLIIYMVHQPIIYGLLYLLLG